MADDMGIPRQELRLINEDLHHYLSHYRQLLFFAARELCTASPLKPGFNVPTKFLTIKLLVNPKRRADPYRANPGATVEGAFLLDEICIDSYADRSDAIPLRDEWVDKWVGHVNPDGTKPRGMAVWSVSYGPVHRMSCMAFMDENGGTVNTQADWAEMIAAASLRGFGVLQTVEYEEE